uniref:NADH dehydrogenase subunit 2 n=1 Tax=Sirsoe methanicola TaxID=378374 RepID=UPI0020374078|nr:NADH dehydrogenase subunit 2 [Sirsoe methanicola]UQV94830.1 NADH dehydrogenase subunit 2 [Sirsoe methanicola]
MSNMPSTSLFIVTLISGTLISISSPQWIMLWAGLEINLLSFIPEMIYSLMTQSHSSQETEAAIKYFLTQALGSGILLLAALSTMAPMLTFIPQQAAALLMLTSLLIKMGAAPFHFWFPHVMSTLSWPSCILLTTWQKIAPIMIISSMTPYLSTPTITIIATLNALIGGIGGINQTQMRPLMAYSSIGHMGWMIGASLLSQSLMLLYLVFYIMITASLMISFLHKKTTLRNTSSMFKETPMSAAGIALLLLSLGGLPPLLGFLPKWALLEQFMNLNFIFIALMLISGSLMNLFYYLSIFMNSNLTPHTYSPKKMTQGSLITLIMSTLTIGITPLALTFI